MSPEAPLPSRRTLVKGAAHAAWAVPVVAVVTAAPALAASGSPSMNLVVTASRETAATNKIDVTMVITNTGSGPTNGNLQLDVQLTTTALNNSVATATSTDPTSFHLLYDEVIQTTGHQFVYAVNTGVVIAANGSLTVTETITLPAGTVNNTPGTASLTIYVNPLGFGNGTAGQGGSGPTPA